MERRARPLTTNPPPHPFACAVGGGTYPDPMAGHPLHPPRGMPRGAHLAGQVMQSVPPAAAPAVSVVGKLGSAVRALGIDIRELRKRAEDPPPPWLS